MDHDRVDILDCGTSDTDLCNDDSEEAERKEALGQVDPVCKKHGRENCVCLCGDTDRLKRCVGYVDPISPACDSCIRTNVLCGSCNGPVRYELGEGFYCKDDCQNKIETRVIDLKPPELDGRDKDFDKAREDAITRFRDAKVSDPTSPALEAAKSAGIKLLQRGNEVETRVAGVEPPELKEIQETTRFVNILKEYKTPKGRAIKYIYLAGHKGDAVKDLQKAIACLEYEIGRLRDD